MTRDGLLLLDDEALARQCEVDRYRASGPGGQHRNKTESAIRLRHVHYGVVVHADGSRSQAENRAQAIVRMREALALGVRLPLPAQPVPWRPDAALAAFIADGGRSITRRTRAAGAVLLQFARLLDVLEACNGELAAAASVLGVGSSALSKLLIYDDAVARATNELRSRHGLRALRQ